MGMFYNCYYYLIEVLLKNSPWAFFYHCINKLKNKEYNFVRYNKLIEYYQTNNPSDMVFNRLNNITI